MKRLCFGTAFKILSQAKTSRITDEQLLCALCDVYRINRNLFSSQVSHLKCGHDSVPSIVVEGAQGMDCEEADRRFQEIIIPILRNELMKPVVLAFIDVLKDDSTLLDETIIGYINGYEKNNIITSKVFCLSSFLASVLYYSIVSVPNKECEKNISEIDKTYVRSFVRDKYDIEFVSSKASNIIPIKHTLIDSTFNNIFEKVYDIPSIESQNHSTIQIYSVDILNSRFRFMPMKKFIIDNITEYVMSRQRIKNMDKMGKLTSIGSQATLKYIKASNISLSTILAETLVYAFLEKELNAPKIMSKIEINEANGISKSDGVHLYRSDFLGLPFHQIVFGSSDIVGNIELAIDNVFYKVKDIEQNSENELQMIESTINDKYFDPDEIEYLVSLLMPQKDKSNPVDLAFGCFVGYTFEKPSHSLSNEEFRKYAKKKMEEDIEKAKTYISQTIINKGLENYSFYFYILPFNDADEEKETIIEQIREGK